MKFRLFDLTQPLPFMQGYAINTINKQIHGTIKAAGEVDEDTKMLGTLLYVKMEHVGKVNTSESIWHDDGCRLECLYQRIDDHHWTGKGENDNGNIVWDVIELEVVILPVAA